MPPNIRTPDIFMIPDNPNISWATIMLSSLIVLDVSTEIGEYHAAIKHSIKWGKDARVQRQVCKTVNIVALQVVAVAMSLIFGSAMLITYLTDGMDTRMVLSVHDELVFDVPEAEIQKASTIIKEEMENVIVLEVPLVVEIGLGDNWLEAH